MNVLTAIAIALILACGAITLYDHHTRDAISQINQYKAEIGTRKSNIESARSHSQ